LSGKTQECLAKEEWSQGEYLVCKKALEAEGVKVLLVDTIAKSIEGAQCTLYNPYVLKEEPKGSVFVFYCDTGKTSKERLEEFRRKFPDHHCVSLRGGRAYWRKSLRLED